MSLILSIPKSKDLLGPCGSTLLYKEDLLAHICCLPKPESAELTKSVSKLSKYIFDYSKLPGAPTNSQKFKKYAASIIEVLTPFSDEDSVIEKFTYLTRDQFEFSGEYRPVLSRSSIIKVAKLIYFLIQKNNATVWGYTKRKKTDCSIKIIFHLQKGLFYLLPRKSTATCSKGTFKIGRKAIRLQKNGKKWVGEEVWHLKGRKGFEDSFVESRRYENELESISKRELLFPILLDDFDKVKKTTKNRQAFFELCHRTLLAELVGNKIDTNEKKKGGLGRACLSCKTITQ